MSYSNNPLLPKARADEIYARTVFSVVYDDQFIGRFQRGEVLDLIQFLWIFVVPVDLAYK